MKTKKTTAEIPLMERFAQTCPDFQRQMQALAKAGGHTVEYVFGLWRHYCQTSPDQSKMVSEFKEWYADELAPKTPANAQNSPQNAFSSVQGVEVPETAPKGNTMRTETESKPGHTPGPWEMDGEDGFFFISKSPNSIAECNVRDGSSEANARLIAAAPELLEALKAQERFAAECLALSKATPDGQEIPFTVMQSINSEGARVEKLRRAAIAKATGKETK